MAAELGELTGKPLTQAEAKAAARPPRVGWKAAVAGRDKDLTVPLAQAHVQLWTASAFEELRTLADRGLLISDEENVDELMRSIAADGEVLARAGRAQLQRLPVEDQAGRQIVSQVLQWAHWLAGVEWSSACPAAGGWGRGCVHWALTSYPRVKCAPRCGFPPEVVSIGHPPRARVGCAGGP